MFNLLPAILLLLMNSSLSGELRDARLQALLAKDPASRALICSMTASVLADAELQSAVRGGKCTHIRIGLAILLSLTPREVSSESLPQDVAEWHLHPEPAGIRLTPSHGSQNRSRDGPLFA